MARWAADCSLNRYVSTEVKASFANPDSGPPFLSITKQIPEEWYHVTTSVPSQQEGVGAIDCHLFLPAGRTYAFDTEIPFQLQLRAPMNHLLAAQGAGLPGDVTLTVPPVLENTKSAGPGPSSSATPSTSRTPLSVLSTLPQKLTGKQTELGKKSPWVRVYLQRRVTSKIYGQNAWSTMNIGEAQLSSMSPPDGVDALVWDGRVVCHKKPHVIFSGFSTSRFEIKDFIVLHVKPEKPEISPWKEHKYCHPVHLVTDPYQG
ncbi:hypothetical protein BC629DRAFT_742886 [Irpex lacteus]|nr:hypothetical protein BC629DRAFT_742886 [Irpex lacteus]